MSSPKHQGTEKSRSTQYWVIGIILALLVGGLIVWNNLPKNPANPAATIGDESFQSDEVGYYYAQVYNQNYQMAQMYQQYGITGGYDVNLTPAEQIYDEESGQTYEDYFRETALTQLQEVAMLKDLATKAGHKLSDEGKASVESQMKSLDSQIMQYIVTQGGNESYYIKAMYGDSMTKPLLKRMIEDTALASEYAEARAMEFTYDADAIDAYYQKNADDLDSYDYHSFFVAANPESDTDEEGNALDPTDEQMATAMNSAKATASAMVSDITAGADFTATAAKYASEGEKDKYVDDYTLALDQLGSALSSNYSSWLKSSARLPNQVEAIEASESGYYVVQFLAREKRDQSYATVDVESIAITAETTETTADDGTVTNEASEEQLATAKAQAEEIVSKWDASTAKTDFLALAPSGDKVVTDAQPELSRNTYGTDFDKWAFNVKKPAKTGDVTIVELTDASGHVSGYRVVLLNGFGPARWKDASETALRDADYQLWFEGEKEHYPISKLDGMNQVGMKQ